jgi:hypothetical protein
MRIWIPDGWPFCTCFGGVRQMVSIFICLSVGVLVNGSQFHIRRWVGQSALPLTRLGVGVTVEWGWGPWGRVRRLPLVSMDHGTSTTIYRLVRVLADGTFCYVLFSGVFKTGTPAPPCSVGYFCPDGGATERWTQKAWVPPYPSHADVLKHLNVLVSIPGTD